MHSVTAEEFERSPIFQHQFPAVLDAVCNQQKTNVMTSSVLVSRQLFCLLGNRVGDYLPRITIHESNAVVYAEPIGTKRPSDMHA